MKFHVCLILLYSLFRTSFGQVPSKFIITDQFGYLPGSRKIAVIKDPVKGFDANESYIPGKVYAVVDFQTGEQVYTGSPVKWYNGIADPVSGDAAWHFDFSGVSKTGRYYLLDVEKNLRSYPFDISPAIYNEVLKQAVRMFFYQRAGCAKEAQFAGPEWADGASHLGPLQDANCRLFSDKNNPATERDLHGGWYDAGDYNKYTTWTANYVTELMKAYLEHPEAWADDYNIPESGNGIPDLIDEAKWGIDFLLRLQQPEGGSLCIVSLSHASPPSSATGQSLYGPATTSATLNSAAAFALSAKVFRSLGMLDYADTLVARAVRAWDWAEANPQKIFNNNSSGNGSLGVGAGNQEEDDYTRSMTKVEAACFLFEQTGESRFREYFDAHYLGSRLFNGGSAMVWESANCEALLYYTTIPGATVQVSDKIKQGFKTKMTDTGGNVPSLISGDPYMTPIPTFTWGSNSIKCAQGCLYYDLKTFGIVDSPEDAAAEAEGYVHYIHGLNPLDFVYLSNMYKYGGDNCVNEFYHTWFCNGSAKWDRVGKSLYGPPPGYLTGGPNPGYNWASCCPNSCGSAENNAQCLAESIFPPRGQPSEKSYRDFNNSWPLDSWEITENSCGYQVNYIRLLSKYVVAGTDCYGDLNGSAKPDACGICSGGNTGITAETVPCNCMYISLPTKIDQVSCHEFTSPSGKYKWNVTGTFADTVASTFGCDSLFTLKLKFGENSYSAFNTESCKAVTSPSGKYSWEATGTYKDTINNYSGCDSIITVNLNLHLGLESTIYPVACQSYVSPSGKYNWTSSGIFRDTISLFDGCDSIINVKLNIRKVVSTLTQSGNKLIADATSGTFRWFLYNGQYELIENASGRSFTPTASGQYAVEVTQYSCTDTSSLILVDLTGLEFNRGSNIRVYPNPSDGKILVTLPEVYDRTGIEIKNAMGELIRSEVYYMKKDLELILNESPGVYFLSVRNGKTPGTTIKLILF
jgi:endoglucanase